MNHSAFRQKSKIVVLILVHLLVLTVPLTSCNSPGSNTVLSGIGIIAAGEQQTVAMKTDGTVVAVGSNLDNQLGVTSWSQIQAIASQSNFTLGLKLDGTVVGTGQNDFGQRNVSGWKDIVSIATGSAHTVGLKKDGTVVAVGLNAQKPCDVSDWQGITAISAGSRHTVGLKKDGTVVAVGWNKSGQCDVSDWKGITAISAGGMHTVGLKKDGTVIAAGDNTARQCDVAKWKGIVAISAGTGHTVGLKKDGTVVAVGWNESGLCNVSNWTDIVAVSAGWMHTVGLKKDGTVIAAGDNTARQCDVSGWTKIGRNPALSVTPEPRPSGTASAALDLWIYTSRDDVPRFMELIDAYKVLEPGIGINLTFEFAIFKDFKQKLSVQNAAGNGPDLYLPNTVLDLKTLADSGFAEPLDGKIDTAIFPKDAFDASTFGGRLYAAPGLTANCGCVFYNKELFENAGASAPTTYMEFLAACGKLKAKGITPMFFDDQPNPTGSLWGIWLSTVQSMIPDYFSDLRTGKTDTFTDPRFLGVFTTILDWNKAGYGGKGEGGDSGFPEIDALVAGDVAMIFSGTWAYALITEKAPELLLGAFIFPGPTKAVAVREISLGLAVNPASPDKQAAIDFVGYSCTLDAAKLQLDLLRSSGRLYGAYPIIKGIEIADPIKKMLADFPNNENSVLNRMNMAGNPEDVLLNSFESFLDGSMTLQQMGETMDASFDFKKYVELMKK